VRQKRMGAVKRSRGNSSKKRGIDKTRKKTCRPQLGGKERKRGIHLQNEAGIQAKGSCTGLSGVESKKITRLEGTEKGGGGATRIKKRRSGVD